ncbi:hypothetical protein XENTR_v10002829 [Xenopus tropicalis]|uniref:Proteinase-activated receptor 1 n=1 Tax=Xenopus tropicalis TaxID=8364 RepID=A0A7D9NKE5_XENTR|nr:proteinase-activated receptor 1 [Xenopus tropicalis]KAE8636075.1 hypothetical protein XENTR_v10002829 [Xenopus tropicalis]|eukprot:XP_004910450.1 PREDICTED: proteinase-activated receptor 1 [Xenopus tropicalis]
MEPRVLLALALLGAMGSLCLAKSHTQPKGAHLKNMTIKTFHIFDSDSESEFEEIPWDELDQSGEGSGDEPLLSRSARKPSRRNITKEAEQYLSSQWLTKFVPSLYTVVFIVGLPLNLLAVIIFLFKMKVRKPAVVYMLNLAIADVFFVSVLPFKIAYHLSGNDWLFGPGMCRIVTATFYCNMYCSVLLIASISADRFLAVVYPMHSLSWRTMSRACMACAFIWVVSVASTMPLLLTEQTQKIPGLDITTCHDVLDFDLKKFNFYYFSSFCLLFFFLPFIITTVCYIGIIRSLSSSSLENSCKKSRALFLAVVVLCVFIVCFGPTNVIFLTHYLLESNESLYFAYILSACIGSISCCLDPLIYYYASSQCQRYLYSLLCCRKVTEPGSSSGQLMSTAMKNHTGSINAKSSIYRKLLV